MPRKYLPPPLTRAEVVESLAVAALALRFVTETGPPPGCELGDAPRYLRDLTRLREGIKTHGLPRSLASVAVAGRGAKRGSGG